MVTTLYIGSFQNDPQTNSGQLGLVDAVRYPAEITYHCWFTQSPRICESGHKAVQHSYHQ